MRILVPVSAVCAVSALLWSLVNRPLSAPDWEGKLDGVAYNPAAIYTQAQLDQIPQAQIEKDLTLLKSVTRDVRTYSVDRGLDRVLPIARRLGGPKISLGIWLSDDRAYNEAEIERAIPLIREYKDVVYRVFVGNEVVLRGELQAQEVVAYLERIRAAVPKKVEVGYADVWSTWLRHPELAKASDFIGIHLLPYWEGIKATRGIDYIKDRKRTIEKTFPGRHIVIAEVGWPSAGRVKRGSVPSPAFEAYFLRHFLERAIRKNYDYYIMEAFDQPWKEIQEGAVGAYWGIFDAQGNPKFSFKGDMQSMPHWYIYALISGVATILLGMSVMRRMPRMAAPGYLIMSVVVGILASGLLIVVDSWTERYVDWTMVLSIVLVLPALLCAALLLLTDMIELALSLWREKRSRIEPAMPARLPFVSIHVPTHNEPPLMVMQTLTALSHLDYPHYEVIVLDNNTADASLWRPVESHCRNLGERFRFHHAEDLKGFKAGALNLALDLTAPRAAFIAVIDSDYQAAPQWLRHAIGLFSDPQVALVQAPQDYRDAHQSLFKRLCYEEYAGFFHIGMVERNEHNAIIQHGTMCVIRKSALQKVGNWAEWCITEDTELGLRLLEAGYAARYVPQSLGRGLMPDSFDAYKKQRYRWVYGAMQILKRHCASVFLGRAGAGGRKLTRAQRYHFVAGWLPWIGDGFALAFVGLAIVWSLAVALFPTVFDVPSTALSGVIATLFFAKVAKTLWLHHAKVKSGLKGACAASLAGLSLTCTVGYAVIAGLLTSNAPFLRTPKCEGTAPWRTALKLARTETLFLLGLALALAAIVVETTLDDPAEIAWGVALAIMAIPFVSSLIVALGSSLQPRKPVVVTPDVAPPGPPPQIDLAA